MKKIKPYLIPILIIITLFFIGKFLYIISSPDRSWVPALRVSDLMIIWGIEGWVITCLSIALCIAGIIKRSFSIIILNIALLITGLYIQTLLTWQAEPGPKIDARISVTWCIALLAFILLVMNLLTYIVILIRNKKKCNNEAAGNGVPPSQF